MAIEHLGSADETQLTVSVERFGPPGTPGELHFIAQVPGEDRSDHARLGDLSERHFDVFALLSKAPLPSDQISARFTAEDGGSYFVKPDTAAEVRVATSWGGFTAKPNSMGELALIQFGCMATTVGHARLNFLRAVLPFLDHPAYMTHAPVFISSMRVEDQKNTCTTLFYTNPFRKQTPGSADLIFNEMAPVYAMYREALNSNSDFHKFLCYYKILEGLLGPLRANAMKIVKESRLSVRAPRPAVPTVAELPPAQREHVGKAVKKVFDDVLTPRYRNAVAHFMTDEGGVLHAGQPEYLDQYAGIILLCELCVREVVTGHEALLKAIAQAA
jgi:hypothetical protein